MSLRLAERAYANSRARLSKWYSRGGDALVDAVWAETLDELAFANVGDILKG